MMEFPQIAWYRRDCQERPVQCQGPCNKPATDSGAFAYPYTVDVLNLVDPTNPVLLDTIDANAEGGGANSVAVRNGVAAVAIEANVKTDPGKVVFYDASTLAKISEVEVGALRE
jgi:hypothetical protein